MVTQVEMINQLPFLLSCLFFFLSFLVLFTIRITASKDYAIEIMIMSVPLRKQEKKKFGDYFK